jgi:ferredoxin
VRVVVDRELCQGHGVCVGEAPRVFRVRERAGDYAQVEILLESPDESLRAQVEAAVRYCPNRALALIEDDVSPR